MLETPSIHPLGPLSPLAANMRPEIPEMEKATSKKLRARLAERAKKTKNPVVRKTISKSSGKVQVSLT